MDQHRQRFTDDDLATIKERINLAEVIGADVELKAAPGGSFKGLCPFHQEKTPSFQVTPAKGFYYCFGCGAGGDLLGYLQDARGLTFPEAVRQMADKAGVQLRAEEDPEQENRRHLLACLAAAHDFYQEQLFTPAAVAAARELQSRGFSADDARTHGCGYAPPGGGALRRHLTSRGFTESDMLAVKLIGENKHRDFFQDRLLWPIADQSGKVRGFSGRRLNPDDPLPAKYVNSAANPLFQKTDLLYRLHAARSLASRTGVLYVVEGYTDVMALEKVGLAAVASCGTAFTDSHVRLLRYLPPATRIVYAFDGDKAGADAAVKAWRSSQPLLDRCEAVLWPNGMDPCDLLHAHGPQSLAVSAAQRVPLTRRVVDLTMDQHMASDDSPEARSRTLRVVRDLLDACTDDYLAREYTAYAGHQLGIAVDAPPRRVHTGQRTPTQPPPPPTAAETVWPSQHEIVYLAGCLADPSWLDLARIHLADDDFTPMARQLLTHVSSDPQAWRDGTMQLPRDLLQLQAQIASVPAPTPGDIESAGCVVRRRAKRVRRSAALTDRSQNPLRNRN